MYWPTKKLFEKLKMSEFEGSMRSSRRSSITSRISVVTLPPLNVQSVRNFTRSSWFETFTFFTTSLPEHEFIDHELYIDVLKCLCDEKLSDAAILHLLTLLEHFAHLFTESDRYLNDILCYIFKFLKSCV